MVARNVILCTWIFCLLTCNVLANDTRESISLDSLSAVSLQVIGISNGRPIATSSGFIVNRRGKNYLITNWHVVSGKDPNQNYNIINESGLVPDSLRIRFHAKVLGKWIDRNESLYDNGKPKWLEHRKGPQVDVVAIPLSIPVTDNTVSIYPLDLSLSDTKLPVKVGMLVYIIGFPNGISASGFPLWKTGHIASEPGIYISNLPFFMVDATTRGGMSGSPVVVRYEGSYFDGGFAMMGNSPTIKFLGVYSAQSYKIEIGHVWRPEVINEIIDNR